MLSRLLNSTHPEDLRAANKLIKEMVQEVSHRLCLPRAVYIMCPFVWLGLSPALMETVYPLRLQWIIEVNDCKSTEKQTKYFQMIKINDHDLKLSIYR